MLKLGYRSDYKAFSRKIEDVSERTGMPLQRKNGMVESDD